MSDILDENKKASSSEEREDGMLIIFPDENDDEEEEVVSTAAESESDGESFSLSFGKVNAARKEEDFNFLPFLNIPEVIDEDDEEEEDDGESFSLSFGKVSAAKKEQDYVYMPFLNVDENAVEEEEQEEEKEEEEEDTGIDIVGGDDFFSMAPLKTKDSASNSSPKSSGSVKNTKSSQNAKRQNTSPKKGKGNAPQKKKQPQRQSAPQKPNKVQQILAQMDPDIIASVSSDPRQMMMLEETIRSELIKQAAHNAVARELSADVVEINEVPRKRPAQQQKQRATHNQGKRAPENTLNFSRQEIPRKNKPISIVDTSFISEFGSEPQQTQKSSQQPIIQNAAVTPVVQTQVQQIPNAAQATPIISQPVIVQPTIQTPPVQQTSAPTPAQSTPRKNYTPTSPAAIRAAMKSGAISFDTPTPAQTSEAAAESATAAVQSVQNRRRMELQKQLGEKRSGCVIGAIALLMVVFIGIIALISGGDIVTQCNYNEQFSKAQSLVASDDYLGAIEVLNEIKGYSQTASLLNECYYALGQRAEEAGDFNAAISYYESCIEYDLAIRGKVDLMKTQADEYRESAESSDNIEDYLSAYTLYVNILSDFESYPEITNESESKEIQNKTDSTRFAYAKLLFGEGNYSDAKVHFDNLMASSYAEANTWYYNSCYNLGRVYFESGNYLSAYDELSCFENERHGIDEKDHLNALAYLSLSTLYKMENPADESVDSLQSLFALFTIAHEGELEEDLMTELESGMESNVFNKIKLIGSWNNDAGNYIVFSDGSITFYVSNEAEGGLLEVYSEEIIFEDRTVSVVVDGTKYVIMENVAFEAKYQMAPRTLTFYNPFDGLTYTMYRFR